MSEIFSIIKFEMTTEYKPNGTVSDGLKIPIYIKGNEIL